MSCGLLHVVEAVGNHPEPTFTCPVCGTQTGLVGVVYGLGDDDPSNLQLGLPCDHQAESPDTGAFVARWQDWYYRWVELPRRMFGTVP